MFVHRYSINKDFNINPSLFLVQCGFEDCAPGHGFGPVIRDHNLIHFIYAGKGYLEIFDNKVSLNAGQGFLIPQEFPQNITPTIPIRGNTDGSVTRANTAI